MAREGGLAQKGQMGQGWADAERGTFGGQATPSGSSNGWKMDLSGLKDLETQLNKIISQFSQLDQKIKSVSGGIGGMGAGSGGSSSLTTANFGNSPASQINKNLATFGAPSSAYPRTTQGPGGARNTSATFGGQAIAGFAAAEFLGQAGGYVNQKMSTLQQGGVPVQLAGAQMATISGRNTAANVSAYNGVLNTGQADQAQAMNMQLQNSFLGGISPSSKNFNNLKGFLNTTQRIGGVSASSAMGLANALTSNQATQFFQQYTGGRGGLLNPNGTLKSPQAAFKSTLQAATGSMGLSGAALSARLKSVASSPGHWTATSMNLQQAGLDASQIALLREVAAKGGNVGNVTNGQISNTQAEQLLTRTTAGTKTANDVFQSTTGLQSAINKVATSLQGLAQKINAVAPGLTQGGAAGAFGLKTAAGVGSQYFMMRALMKGMGGMGGASGEGGMLGGLLGEGGGASAAGAASAAAPYLGIAAAGAASYVGTSQLLKHTVLGRGVTNAASGIANLLGVGPADSHGNSRFGSGTDAYLKSIISGQVHSNTISKAQAQQMLTNQYGDPMGSHTTSGMQPNLAHAITAMKQANPAIQINSGHRSGGQQAALYAMKGGRGVAPPGQSPHQLGKAADLGPTSQQGWIAANASKFGLATDRNEPWHVQVGDPTPAGATTGASGVTGASVVAGASAQLGVNYVWGGETPGKAFDCSGLVQYVFGKLGISLPRTSQAQATCGKPVSGLNNAQAGDIILYNEPGEGPNSHVAIYIGGGKQIAAPHTGTVVQVQSVDTSHISTIRRVISGGAGKSVVAAAQSTVGQSSSDSSNHSGSSSAVSGGTGLSNTFIAGLAGSWIAGGGPAGGGAGGSMAPAAGGTSGSSGTTTTASTGSTAMAGGGGGPISNPTGFSKAVLAGLGIAATVGDVTNLNAWQQMEGQWGAKGIYNAMQMHDPLNTNLPEKGGHSLNGTWFYPDWGTGVAATVATIKQGNMAKILGALQSNDNLAAFSSAAEGTPWAASAYGGRAWPAPSGTYAVGDPVGGFHPAGGGMGGSGGAAGVSGASRRGGGIEVHLGPIYVNGNQSDANNIASMVASAIKNNSDLQAMASN